MTDSNSQDTDLNFTAQLDTVEHLLAQFEQLESELEQVRQGLIHSHRLATIGTIASVVAHEYNNILTPMSSYCQLALSQPDNKELCRTALEKSLEGSERMAKISSSLLGFSREREREKDAMLPLAIEDAVQCLGRDPRKDRIELSIDVPDVRVAMPALNLQQVLLNLMLNSRRVMARTGGKLMIQGSATKDMLELTLADTGPGIPTEIADRLFEPFVTYEHDDHPSDSTGTGLGLSICRDLMSKAGGHIELDTSYQAGAAFKLRIPLAND